jgi:hypothetical protein
MAAPPPLKPTSRYLAAMCRRIDIAQRWYGLKTRREIDDFLKADPDLAKIRANRYLVNQAIMEGVRHVIDRARTDPQGCIELWGREVFDLIVEKHYQEMLDLMLANYKRRIANEDAEEQQTIKDGPARR